MSIRLSLATLMASALLMGLAREAQAVPQNGYCLACHGTTANSRRTTAMDVTGFDSTMAVANRLDGGTPNPLPTYTVQPGGTVTLSFAINDGRNSFSLGLFGLDAGGVKTSASNLLSFTPDPGWTPQFDTELNRPYYSLGIVNWTSATTRDFTLTLGAGTPADVYALEVIAAGLGPGNTSGTVRWADPQEFYLNVVNAVPEPSAVVALIGCGAIGLVWWSRRRRQGR